MEQVWWVAENGRSLAYLSSLPGAKIIARFSPLAPDEEREAATLERRILDGLVAARRKDLIGLLDSPLVTFALDAVPGVDQDDARPLAELNAKVDETGGCRCGVVAMPAEEAPVDIVLLSIS